ncbi:MAG: hypothetical protein A2078_16540 [Nitrospirae bacterium GWC2_57_9]|nr:MAG: hypothetical protein A2078_16540 [Nitrospirae bacterium GWC2_57_9]
MNRPSVQNNDKLHVMQIVGDPVGGIRKHVHTIIQGIDPSRFVQSYAYSQKTDTRFRHEISDLHDRLSGELKLKIKKKPGLLDIVNLYKLMRYVKRHKVDIVHGHGAKGGLYARVVSRLCDIRSVYTPHGGSVHKMFTPLADAIYIFTEKLLFSMTDFFLFESRYSADAYHSKTGQISDCWMVNYNGTIPPGRNNLLERASEFGSVSEQNGTIRVGVFGMLRREKGQIYAIKAIEMLRKQGRKVSLHLFGDGPDKTDLMEYVGKAGLQDAILFHGEVAETEMHMIGMDLIMVPSLFESFGYAAIEAMALELPVITSEVGGLREIVINGKTGVLVKPADPHALADAITRYQEVPAAFKQYAAAGYERYLELFNGKRMISSVENVYNRLAEKTSDQ